MHKSTEIKKVNKNDNNKILIATFLLIIKKKFDY